MKQLYAPWRENYTTGVAHAKNSTNTESECVFCNDFAQDTDEKYMIVARYKHMIVMLNRFPYNAGHLLILPHGHIADLHDLSSQARSELIELTNHSINALKKVLHCDGVNVGLNLGKAAGAGIPSHLHMHVLPRFTGDTNFLPVLCDTKQISFDLHNIYQKLKPEFDSISL